MRYNNIPKDRFHSWKDLEESISSLPTTKAIGQAFEEFVYAYLTLHSQKYQISELYLSHDIPDKYRIKYKIGSISHQDSGVDGIIIRTDGKCVAFQCKFRSGRIKPSYEELTKFWSDGRYCDYLCTIANCSSLTQLSEKHEQNIQILVNEFDSLDDVFFSELHSLVNGNEVVKEFYKPYKYQEKIIEDVVSGFKIEDRGKIIAACGTGKTLTSLWIVEKMDLDLVLFLAPSITLVKQTLESWSDQAKIKFSYLCVCSDNTVSKDIEADETDTTVSQIGVPVTTDEKKIADFISTSSSCRKYIFSTYQSADKISNAILLAKSGFDLIILDEAHRTAGLRSQFSLALEDQFIQSKKRLFMTATERMVRPMLKRKAENNGEVIFSMDDETTYGPLFSRYNFGDAIKDKTISDYKIVIAGVKESEVYSYIASNELLRLHDIDENEKKATASSLYAKILLAKVFSEFPVKKTISFHSSIQRAKNFVSENSEDVSLRNVMKEFNPHLSDDETLYINTINCQVDASQRTKIMSQFKNETYSILSNAKCLTEGVDVPIIDSVYFVDRKKSLVDIVQACGRALRTKRGVSKTAYFIVPILIPDSSVSTDILYSEEFEVVYNIIQALRDQDNRLEDWIDRLNRKYVKGDKIAEPQGNEDDPIIVLAKDIDILDFSEQLYAQIASVNANPEHRVTRTYERGDRKTGHSRLFKTVGDYGFESYMHNLVNPTIDIYKRLNSHTLKASQIKIDHNNISHTKRIGLIDKNGSNYTLTPLGEKYLKGKISERELFRRQLLRYSCTIEDASINRILFPYRACLEILKGLPNNKKVSFYEFAFCIYPLYDSSESSIKEAIEDIQYLRNTYPRLEQTSLSNQTKILNDLNTHFCTSFSETDIWGTRTTTVKNQYIYFRNQLAVFDEVIDPHDKCIKLKPNTEKIIDELLQKDVSLLELDRPHLLAKYGEAFMILMMATLNI